MADGVNFEGRIAFSTAWVKDEKIHNLAIPPGRVEAAHVEINFALAAGRWPLLDHQNWIFLEFFAWILLGGCPNDRRVDLVDIRGVAGGGLL